LLLLALGGVALRLGPLAPVRVTVQTVASASVAPALFGIGTVEARRSYLIGPTAAARVRQLHVDVGDMVRAGQLLAEMDPVDLDERLVALDASIARAGSAAAAAEAQQQDALARQSLAAANTRRYADLAQQGFISPGALQSREQEQASADAGVAVALANRAAARQDLQRLAAERAGLGRQRDSLRLLAPADALVTSRDAEPGSTVVAGQAVLRLIEPASLWLRVRFDQGRSGALAAGLPAAIVLRSDPARPLPGRVARVEALSDPVTEERMALVAFDEMPSGVSVGELAEVTVHWPPAAALPVVPNASLQRQGAQVGAWRVDGDGLRYVPLRLGLAGLDGQVQVLEGLRAGDRVVVHSEKPLDARSRIRVVDQVVDPRSGQAGATP
jgi:HlyD family secretion protein